jgi:hypothetical protein
LRFRKRSIPFVAISAVLLVLTLLLADHMAAPTNSELETASQTPRDPSFRPQPPPPTPEPLKYAVEVSAEIDFETWTEQSKSVVIGYVYNRENGIFPCYSISEEEHEYSAVLLVSVKNVGKNNLHSIELSYHIYNPTAMPMFKTATIYAGDLATGETKTVKLTSCNLEWTVSQPRRLHGQVVLRSEETSAAGVYAHLFWLRDQPVANSGILKWSK